jgi:hypothetical protein
MKKIIIYSILLILAIGCSQSKKELYEITDEFVLSLETTYESYGVLGCSKYSETTTDGLYTVMPIGRLINVKIQKFVDDEEYESLRRSLEKHYKNNHRVNKVYINQGGTIMVDCRN